MGLLDRPALREFTKVMTGRSLFRPLPEERVIYALNNTAARHWSNEGFALVLGQEKYVFSERGGHEYYDLSRDRDERTNLGRAIPCLRSGSFVPSQRPERAPMRPCSRSTRLEATACGSPSPKTRWAPATVRRGGSIAPWIKKPNRIS